MQNVNLYWLIPEVLTGLLAVALIWRYADWIVAWLKSKNWTAHTVTGLLVVACGIIAESTQTQSFISSTLGVAHPAAAAQIVSLAIIVAKYSHSSSQAGTLATARNIEATTSIPTAKIDAADITTK